MNVRRNLHESESQLLQNTERPDRVPGSTAVGSKVREVGVSRWWSDGDDEDTKRRQERAVTQTRPPPVLFAIHSHRLVV